MKYTSDISFRNNIMIFRLGMNMMLQQWWLPIIIHHLILRSLILCVVFNYDSMSSTPFPSSYNFAIVFVKVKKNLSALSWYMCTYQGMTRRNDHVLYTGNVWHSRRQWNKIGVFSCRKTVCIDNIIQCYALRSLTPSDTYICFGNLTIIGSDNGLSLDRRQAITEPILEYCRLDPYEQIAVKFLSKFIHFHSWKCNWNCCLQNGVYFASASML